MLTYLCFFFDLSLLLSFHICLGQFPFERPVLYVFGGAVGEGCPGAGVHAFFTEGEVHVGWE